MNEAERCDRISLMHQGKVLVSDTPGSIVRGRGAATLEDAFISYLEEAIGERAAAPPAGGQPEAVPALASAPDRPDARGWRRFDPRRMLSYTMREGLEPRRDPVRMTLAVLGSVILLVIISYGLNIDVDNLTFAVLDRDQTTTSQNYQLNIAGSRYFIERPPIVDYADLDRRMRSGEISLAIEIPPRFARDAARGRDVEVAAWIDGAMPTRGETIRGYVHGVHAGWISEQVPRLPGERAAPGPTSWRRAFATIPASRA